MSKSIELFKPGQLKRIIILGMGRQLLTIEKFSKLNNIEIEIFTGQRHKNLTLDNGKFIVNELEERGIKTTFCSALQNCEEGPYSTFNENTLVFSFGAPFIIKQDLIDLYKNRVINSHGAPLPRFRGGGGLSWRFLAGCCIGSVIYHLVTSGIDDGEIIYQKNYEFPKETNSINDWLYLLEREEDVALLEFLNFLKNGKSFFILDQNESQSSYFPRLNSNINGYINFEWNGDYIERFIKAFSSPYNGALTHINEQPIKIFNAKFTSDEIYDHPFFNGLLIRIHNNNYYICVSGGILEVPIQSIVSSAIIKVGDRFFTPRELLEKSLTQRIVYTPDGLK